MIFNKTQIGNPLGNASPRDPFVYGFGINREVDDSLLVMAGLTVTIFSNHIAFPWRGSHSSLARLGATYTMEVEPNGYSWLIFTGAGWILSHYKAGNTRVTSVTLTDDGTVDSNETVLTTSTNQSRVLTSSKYASSTSLIKSTATIAQITNSDGVSYTPVTGSSMLPFAGGASDVLQNLIATEGGQTIVVGRLNGLGFSLNYGASWQGVDAVTGSITSVWHLGEDSYTIAGNNSVYYLDGLSTGTVVVDKTGNLQQLVTGSFTVTAIRHY